ncbi:MAG: hypothetical protein WBR18_03660 [Anaerolineales bacterium]
MASRLRRFGWIAFGLMWIPFIGIFIGMLGMPDGSYDWVELPMLARTSLIATGTLMAVSMLLIFGSPLLSWRSNSLLRKNGRKGEGIILDLQETGTTVNNSYLVHIELEVHPMGEPSFVASTERLINRLNIPQLQPGTRVPVRYDSKSKTVALDLPPGSLSQGQPSDF